ncbi:SRPBCC family protein [Agriterribacter sp.]|uniref:SRPBCC family protein n=1 Tax=Agriterribacter sp. TaxID=2821509 RepID=UPI002B883217|nr:SRPBCC family protein [Agriterribacter sp.]HTN08551.1 SRPBCC family protein [Agriterribacter sp.]
MSGKGWIITSIILIIGSGIFLLSRLSFRVKKEITVNASLFIVSRQITDLHNWQKWYPRVKETDSAFIRYSGNTTQVNATLQCGKRLYTVMRVNPEEINIKEAAGKKLVYHAVIAVSDQLGVHTRVQWSATFNFFSWLSEKIHPTGGIDHSIRSLKEYIETPLLYYGFPIEMQRITDTLLISKKDTVLMRNAPARLEQLFDDLLLYAHTYRPAIESSRILGVFPVGKDSAEVIANIPVHHKAPEKNGIMYLRMPEGGKIVTTMYKGLYRNIGKAHKALQQYISDRSLKKIALSYEKYFTATLPVNDSAEVKVQVCYPVF